MDCAHGHRMRATTANQAVSQSNHVADSKRNPDLRRGFWFSQYLVFSIQIIDQNVMLHVSIRPVSTLALSFTRRFHVPFNSSEDRLTV